jgi:hypothetical protein
VHAPLDLGIVKWVRWLVPVRIGFALLPIPLAKSKKPRPLLGSGVLWSAQTGSSEETSATRQALVAEGHRRIGAMTRYRDYTIRPKSRDVAASAYGAEMLTSPEQRFRRRSTRGRSVVR